MSKIIVLANSPGGLFLFRNELLSYLLKNNDIIIICPKGQREQDLCKLGCKIIHVSLNRRGINPRKDIRLFIDYCRIFRQEKPDYAITYTIKPNIYGGAVARLKHIPYAINVTGLGTAFEQKSIIRAIATIMSRFSMAKARIVFFENETDCERMINLKITKKEKTKVLHGAGVNLDRFILQPYPNGTPFRFLFIGRIMKEKGVCELIQAIKRLRTEGHECVLDMLGIYEESFESIIELYQHEGWLFYHGFQNDVRPFIRDAHCFVLPSWHEGMANTNLECAASGRPVITTNIPGCKEAVIDGISGFLCEPHNTDSIYTAMKKMLALGAAERKKMGLEGRKHMELHFDKKEVVDQTVSCLGL